MINEENHKRSRANKMDKLCMLILKSVKKNFLNFTIYNANLNNKQIIILNETKIIKELILCCWGTPFKTP